MLRRTYWLVGIPVLALTVLLLTTLSPSRNNLTSIGGANTIVSDYVREYVLPSRHSAPLAIVADESGIVWYAATNTSRIGKFNPKDGIFVEYQIPTSEKTTSIWSMAFDQKGNLWLPSTSDNSIWMFNTNVKEFKRYQIPTNNSFPMQVAVDGFGRIWFTELYGNKLGVIDPSTGSVTEYSPPTKDSGPVGLYVARNGSMWFTQAFSNTIGKYEPRTGKFTEYNPSERIYSPVGIAVDDDGSVWFTEHGGGLFGRFIPLNGTVRRYPTSLGVTYPATLPYWITRDGSGRIWFNEHTGNRIAVFDPNNLVLVEYEVLKGRLANILQLALGKKGEVWFSQWTENKIGSINTTKSIPFEIIVDPLEVTIRPGETVKINVTVKGKSTERIFLNVSSTTSYTSRLRNITILFEPSSLELSLGVSYSILTLTAHDSLQPGDYFLAVTATNHKVLYSKLVKVHVRAKG